MPCKKFILKTLFIWPPGPLKVYNYHSTKTTVSKPLVVIPNQAATSIHSEVRNLARKKFQRKSNLQYNYKFSCEHVLIQAVKRTENSHESNFNLLSSH